MVGGCVQHRPTTPPAALFDLASDLKKNAPASNDVRERKVRDPRFIKRKRKRLQP